MKRSGDHGGHIGDATGLLRSGGEAIPKSERKRMDEFVISKDRVLYHYKKAWAIIIICMILIGILASVFGTRRLIAKQAETEVAETMVSDPLTQDVATLDDGTQVVVGKLYLMTDVSISITPQSGMDWDKEQSVISKAQSTIDFVVSDPGLVAKINRLWESDAQEDNPTDEMEAKFRADDLVVKSGNEDGRVLIYGNSVSRLSNATKEVEDVISSVKVNGIKEIDVDVDNNFYIADTNRNIIRDCDPNEFATVNDLYVANYEAQLEQSGVEEEAVVEESVGHMRARLFGVGAGVGFILGNVIIWLLIVWDKRLWSETEIEKNGGLSVLCVLKKGEFLGIYGKQLVKRLSEGKLGLVKGAEPRYKLPDSIGNKIIPYMEIDAEDNKDICIYIEKGMFKQNELVRIVKQIELAGKNIIGCLLNEG